MTTHEVWTAEGSPHRIPRGIHVMEGGSVTVNPCGVVLAGAGRGFLIQDGAALVAVGAPDQPIWFGPAHATPSAGDWLGIEVRARALPSTRLAWVTVDSAGGRLANPSVPPAGVRSAMESGLGMSHAIVRNSAGLGIAMLDHGGFASETMALTVTGAQGEGAVRFDDVDQVRTLPEGNYNGNVHDTVLIAAHGRVVETSGTWRNPGNGVVYQLRRGARIRVEGTHDPVLTIAPGAHLNFDDDAELDIGWDAPGALIAEGTDEAHRVVFASVTDRPAQWTGIFLGPHTDLAHTSIRWCEIANAGAESSFAAEVCADASPRSSVRGMLLVQGIDAAPLVTHTVFRAGPADGYAIVRSGDFEASPGDYTSGEAANSFEQSGTRCRQSVPRVRGSCSATARCD